jgi:surfeit locus 1 family protein
MKNDYSTDPSIPPAGSPAPGDVPEGAAPRPPNLRSRLGWFVVALLAASLTARFGVWQLSRAHQKEATAAMIAERSGQPALAAAELARDAATGEGQWQRHIVLQGRWDAAHTVFLMNRTMDDRSGFLVTTPLRLPGGDAVVVQRGWLPRDDAEPMKAPALATPDGDVRVRGHVAPWPSHWIEIGKGPAGPVRQNLEREALSAESGLALRPVTVVEEAIPDNARDGLRRDWPAPDIGVATNYGYAVQWFAMSVAFLGLWAWVQFFRRRPPSSPDPRTDRHVDDPAAP